MTLEQRIERLERENERIENIVKGLETGYRTEDEVNRIESVYDRLWRLEMQRTAHPISERKGLDKELAETDLSRLKNEINECMKELTKYKVTDEMLEGWGFLDPAHLKDAIRQLIENEQTVNH